VWVQFPLPAPPSSP